MTPDRFDELSREFADGVSRRAILKTLAWLGVGSIFPSIPVVGSPRLRPQAPTCVTTTVTACITAANAAFESESQDCRELSNNTPQAVARCIAAARRRRDVKVKGCDPCPAGTRCESNTCCPNSRVTCAPPCQVTRTKESSTLQSTVTSNLQGQNLILTTTRTIPSSITRTETGLIKFRRGSGSPAIGTGTTTITLGQNQLLQLEYSSGNGVIQTKVAYGSAFQGIRQATFTGNGDRIQGTIDGRAIVPFAPGMDLNEMKFTDGKPPPVVKIEPQILQAMNDIVAKGHGAASTCLKTHGSQPVQHHAQSPACIACNDHCSDKYWTCAEIAGAACGLALFGWAACEELALIKCQTDYDSCVRDCSAPGEVCCPVKCDSGGCCEEGSTCCHNSQRGTSCCGSGMRCASENTPNGICCPQDSGPACLNHCCPTGQICVDATRGICCPAGTRLCGDTCCPIDRPCLGNGLCCNTGDSLCGGECCPREVPCIDDFCCRPPVSRICGTVCCPGLLACCNEVCCGDNDLCVDNKICCPRDRVCGHICCPSGQKCQNPATQTCAPCPSGTEPCVSVGSNGITVAICCPPGANCCAGKCCTNQTGHECTGPGGTCGTIH